MADDLSKWVVDSQVGMLLMTDYRDEEVIALPSRQVSLELLVLRSFDFVSFDIDVTPLQRFTVFRFVIGNPA
jgi:hypothetical protein